MKELDAQLASPKTTSRGFCSRVMNECGSAGLSADCSATETATGSGSRLSSLPSSSRFTRSSTRSTGSVLKLVSVHTMYCGGAWMMTSAV